MAKQTKAAWYGVAAVAIGTGIFFLAANEGRLFKKGKERIKALVSRQPGASATAPAPGNDDVAGRTPTP